MKRILLAPCLLVLSACSSEPSQADLEKAVQVQYDAFNAQSAALGANSPASRFNVHGVKKIGCKKKAEPKTFSCEIEVDLTIPLMGRHKSVKTVGIADKGSHWQVLNVI